MVLQKKHFNDKQPPAAGVGGTEGANVSSHPPHLEDAELKGEEVKHFGDIPYFVINKYPLGSKLKQNLFQAP